MTPFARPDSVGRPRRLAKADFIPTSSPPAWSTSIEKSSGGGDRPEGRPMACLGPRSREFLRRTLRLAARPGGRPADVSRRLDDQTAGQPDDAPLAPLVIESVYA